MKTQTGDGEMASAKSGADDSEARRALEVANRAYDRVWAEFLANRRPAAVALAETVVGQLQRVPEEHRLPDDDVTEADCLYILGACKRNDPAYLTRATTCYERHLAQRPRNVAARRMLAETCLRRGLYSLAFDHFDRLLELRLEEEDKEDVAPFRLRHDADLLACLAKRELLEDADGALSIAASYRRIADALESAIVDDDAPLDAVSKRLHRIPLAAVPEEFRRDLRNHLGKNVPKKESQPELVVPAQVLSPALDWDGIARTFASERIVVVDDFFSPQALAEMQRFAVESGDCFRTVRAGFLGAFPGDGLTHPLLRRAVEDLEAKLPSVLAGHPLGLWWLFKYTGAGRKGIGLHADPAAVNMNIWLTPDDAIVTGGGLDVFKYVPPLTRIQDVNHEFESEAAEADFRAELEPHGVVSVPYKCNRATIFVSDLYHVSQPFETKEGYENMRVNLTLLFGDRQDIDAGTSAGEGTAAPAGDGWDLFD